MQMNFYARNSLNNDSSDSDDRDLLSCLQSYSSSDSDNNDTKIDKISFLDGVIKNPSLCASVETDIKTDNRKNKQLSKIKSVASYNQTTSSALDRKPLYQTIIKRKAIIKKYAAIIIPNTDGYRKVYLFLFLLLLLLRHMLG